MIPHDSTITQQPYLQYMIDVYFVVLYGILKPKWSGYWLDLHESQTVY